MTEAERRTGAGGGLRLLWGLLLVAGLVAVVVLNRSASQGGEAPADAETLRQGFRLEESAQGLGIDFVHRAPTFDHRLDPIMPQIATLSSSGGAQTEQSPLVRSSLLRDIVPASRKSTNERRRNSER